MVFEMVAKATFEAEGIDDAFQQLQEHFTKLRLGVESDLIESGEIHIHPLMGAH